MIALDTEESLQATARCEHDIDERRDLHEAVPGLRLGPKLGAIVEIEENRHAGGICRLDGRHRFGARSLADRWGNARNMERACPREDRCPIELTRIELRKRGVFPVIEH